MVHKKTRNLFYLSLLATPLLNADVTRSFWVEFVNPESKAVVKVVTQVTGKSGDAYKVASFNDAKGNTYSVHNTANYDEAQRKFANTFWINMTPPNQEIAQVVLPETLLNCTLRDQTTCRARHEAPGIVIEVESGEAAARDDSAKVVQLNVASSKGIVKEDLGVIKVLENATLATYLEDKVDTLLYSDTQSKAGLDAKAEIDSAKNIGLTFKGKDGSIFLLATSGVRSVIEMSVPLPAPGMSFRRDIEVEPVLGEPEGLTVQLTKANLAGILAGNVLGDNHRISYDATLLYDATTLKPDPAQSDYTPGSGLLVFKQDAGLNGTPPALKAYWDIEPTVATDKLRRFVRTQAYKVTSGDKERVLKVRSLGGQRAVLTVSDSQDPTQKDTSTLEYDWVQQP